MAKPLVIFGLGQMAELAHYYFENDSDYDVVGFVVDPDFKSAETFLGLPVVTTEGLVTQFNPKDHSAFVAIGYSKLNENRREKCELLEDLDYILASYISSHATVLNDGKIGRNCFILEDNTVQPFVTIGDNVTLWSGNHIGHHTTIGDHNFIASHVVISGNVRVGKSCFIGVNVTIRDDISIGDKCVFGAGATIIADCDAEGVYPANSTERARIPSSRLRKI